MIRTMAIVFGIALIFAGVAGFLPDFSENGLLLGYFQIDFVHNIIHLATGVIAILAAMRLKLARWYFRIFGLLYGAVAVLGIFWHGDLGVMMMHMNTADNVLHSVIAIVALYLGFIA